VKRQNKRRLTNEITDACVPSEQAHTGQGFKTPYRLLITLSLNLQQYERLGKLLFM